ncbi:mucin-3B-like [Saccostrea cucullata]|uniref:mucin-3B-like n=1 Tax=Saccostrea cuccullata TaxID=36930 RepID=UPI002ED20217
MGKYFFENMDSKCFLTVKQVNINQTEVRELQIERNLQERTLFEGFCPLSFDTNGIWTTEIKFNISNDGKRYSDTYEFIVYQSLCQEYHNESGNVYFTLKENFCYIDSICIRPLQNNSKNKCSYCNATSNQFNWTENETCGQTTSERMLTTMLNTVTESTVMSFTEREENYTSSSTTAAQEEKTLSQITGSLTTSQTEQASLVSNTLPEESSTLMSTDMPEIDTTDFTEMTESISKTYVDTTTGLSVTEAITLKPTFTSTSTTKASTTLKETTTITSKLTITTVITTEADLQTTPSFPPSLTEVNTQFISESTTKSTTNIETSTAQPSPTVSTKKSETSTIPSTAKLDTLQTTTIAETKSTISTETSQPVTTSEGRVGTTTSNDKGNTNDKSIQAQVRNTQLIVGASVSFVGIIIIMVIIGLVARKCRKPNKNARHQREDFGQLRNWRDLALAGKENTSTSQYDSNLSDPHIPHASLHHFKSQ